MPAPPRFTERGLLPPGEYALTLAELAESPLVAGLPGGSTTWDSAWRARLVANLGVLVEQLWRVGIEEIYIDGSFAEAKDRPNDIDGYFVCDPHRFASGELERDLNRLDAAKCWTWDHRSRRPCRGSPKLQLPMWHAYRVNCTRISLGLLLESMSTTSRWSFRLSFARPATPANPRASSESSESPRRSFHDPQ